MRGADGAVPVWQPVDEDIASGRKPFLSGKRAITLAWVRDVD